MDRWPGIVSVDELGVEMEEQIWEKYLDKYPVSDKGLWSGYKSYEIVQNVTGELVVNMLITI